MAAVETMGAEALRVVTEKVAARGGTLSWFDEPWGDGTHRGSCCVRNRHGRVLRSVWAEGAVSVASLQEGLAMFMLRGG